MRRFFGTGITAWSQLVDSLHVYVLPDDDLRFAMAPYQAVLASDPACSVQPPEFLHATVQRLPWFATHLGPEERDRLDRSLADAVREVEPFDLTLGRPVVGAGGVTIRGTADGRWDELVERVRAAAVGALGAEPPLPGAPLGPHLSLGYAVRDADDEPLQRQLDQIADAGPSTLRVDTVDLLAVHQDPTAGIFTWDAMGRYPLATVRTPSGS